LVDFKQNFSKQVFGYFLAAKSDKEKKVAEKMELAERDSFLMRYHLAGVFVWKKMFFSTKLRQAVAVLLWGHNLVLINKVQSLEAVAFYANETVEKGWRRDLLLNAIKMDSFNHQQIKSHNFIETHSLSSINLLLVSIVSIILLLNLWVIRDA